MPRGGKRKGSGRKSTWKSGCRFEDTKLIRVPKAIVDELLKIAHRLDEGETLDLVTKQLDLLQSPSEIHAGIRLSGKELAIRLGVSSGAITNWVRYETLEQKTKENDPDGIAWVREGKKYRPFLDECNGFKQSQGRGA